MADPQLILVVDDDANFREIFSTQLGALGYKVEIAENGEEGIKKAQELKPSLVLMDMRMPGLSGADALLKLKENESTRGIKVLFLSNVGDPQPQAQEVAKKYAEQSGAIGYLRKTDDITVLIEQIKEFIK